MSSLVEGLIGLGVLLLIFLVCREIVCWYWKINHTTELLEKILHELKTMNRDERTEPTIKPAP